MKICSKCGIKKSFTEYYFRKDKNIYKAQCRKCDVEQSARYVKNLRNDEFKISKHREKAREYAKRKSESTKSNQKAYQKQYIKEKRLIRNILFYELYGFTYKEYLRWVVLESFKEKCIKLFGRKYDYSLVTFNKAIDKINIKCKEHGVFVSTPNRHTSGSGCPRCATFGFNKGKSAFFYILSCESYCKIGITHRNVSERVATINRSSGYSFKVIKTFYYEQGKDAHDIEQYFLKELRENYKQPKEHFDGRTECFINVDISTLIKRIEEYDRF